MNLAKFIKAANTRLSVLQSRGWTGRLLVAIELQSGKPSHAECTDQELPILNRGVVSDTIAVKLQACYVDAQRQNPQFFGRIQVELDIFEGIVVDTRTRIKQTFLCSP